MTARRIEWAVNLVTGLVVVSIALALAGLTWRLMGEPGGRPRAAVVAPAPAAVLPQADIAPVLQAAPFGAAPDPQAALGAGDGLGLQLSGIFRARNASASTALIAASGGEVQSVGVGGSVGGAIVESIEVDHVVLSLGGRRERLGFPERAATSTAGVASIRALIPDAVSGLPPQAAPAPSGAPPIPGAPVGPASPAPPGPASAVEAYRDRIAGNPQTLLGALGASPTPQGYRVGPAPSADMRRAGLLPGDVVASVNGAAVGDVERDRRLFEEAVVSGRARVEVIRDGRRIFLSFPLR